VSRLHAELRSIPRAFSLVAGLCAGALQLAACDTTARGEIFHLESGGQVRGEIVNKNEDPRATYVVKTAAGGQIALDAAQVRQVEHQTPAEINYDRLKLTTADTVKGNWELAEFCRENKLAGQRKTHLERIVALEPEHAEARHALGFTKVKGKWTTQEQGMTADGLVKYKGVWRTRQEVELMEQQRKNELATKEWFKLIRRYRSWIDKGKSEQGREKIAAITDPYAARALAQSLEHETDRELKMMWIDALARLTSGAGYDALVTASIDNDDEEVRIACMERLYAGKYKPAVRRYVQLLKGKQNSTVNLAATGLSYMKDASAVPALIDALVTTHSHTVTPGAPPGQMSSTFGGGGGGGGSPGGFSFGQPQPQTVKLKQNNPEVLRTLTQLSGVNFDFNVPAWKYWYANQKKPATLDARRDSDSK
jgi:hypothetical protein